jgi:hypothetical protein
MSHLTLMRGTGVNDDHEVLLRLLQVMLAAINTPTDFELACVYAHEVRNG